MAQKKSKTNNTIHVLDYGWILVGETDGLELKNASVVRRWGNGKGIGALADIANKADYTLDFIGDVVLRESRIIFSIPCNW